MHPLLIYSLCPLLIVSVAWYPYSKEEKKEKKGVFSFAGIFKAAIGDQEDDQGAEDTDADEERFVILKFSGKRFHPAILQSNKFRLKFFFVH